MGYVNRKKVKYLNGKKVIDIKNTTMKINNIPSPLNPFDVLAEEAIGEYKEGRTRAIEEYVKKTFGN